LWSDGTEEETDENDGECVHDELMNCPDNTEED
jgi:hypothetical protein